jgi:hypothetical protein
VSCVGCPPPPEPKVQRAEKFRAWYVGGRTYEGDASEWGKMPGDGMLGVKVFFNDGTARNCSGNDWYGLLILDVDTWTIAHNNNEDNEKRYPTAIWKRGQWASEAEMHEVEQAMNGA